MKVWLSSDPLSSDEVCRAVSHPMAGAVVLFLGVVREENEGRAVTRLDYSAYAPMAVAEMKRIVEALEAERPGVVVSVAHRIGELAVGDVAVVCAASAKHRPDAFLATREAIDRIKAEAPIWKREHGPEGAAWVGWVDARCTSEDHAAPAAPAAPGTHTHAHATSSLHAASPLPRAPLATHATRPPTPSESQDRTSSQKERGADESCASLRTVTITVSDTRTPETDASGRALVEELSAFTCVRHVIVRDEPEALRAVVRRAIDEDLADVVVLTGGTGIAPRDTTYEALTGMFEKTLDGFGEAFRTLSWAEIGPRAMLSRATAGVVGKTIVFALPGSTNAARLGARALVAKVAMHAVALARGEASHGSTTKEPR